MTSDDYKAGLKPKLPESWDVIKSGISPIFAADWQVVAKRKSGGAALMHHFGKGVYHVRWPETRFKGKNWVQRSRQFPTPEAALSFYELTRG